VEALSEADEYEARQLGIINFPDPLLPPRCESASGPMEIQGKLDAWCAAGGYENQEFQAFFGLKAD
jgi:hypothetical protein